MPGGRRSGDARDGERLEQPLPGGELGLQRLHDQLVGDLAHARVERAPGPSGPPLGAAPVDHAGEERDQHAGQQAATEQRGRSGHAEDVGRRQGVVELFTDASSEPPAKAAIERLMAALGHAEWFEDEALFVLAGHLTAAAPAYLFRFLDALASAAAELGLPTDQATRLAALMAEGAAALAAGSGETPQALARRVASPGGTTEAGLKVLDAKEALRGLVLRALDASRRRGEEMARAAGEPGPS